MNRSHLDKEHLSSIEAENARQRAEVNTLKALPLNEWENPRKRRRIQVKEDLMATDDERKSATAFIL